MLDVTIKFGARAHDLIDQVRMAGYVVPDTKAQRFYDLDAAAVVLAICYRLRVIDKQDVDAARVRIKTMVRKMKLKRVKRSTA